MPKLHSSLITAVAIASLGSAAAYTAAGPALAAGSAVQAPPAGRQAGPGGGRGGRGGGLPDATPEQNQAVTDMNASLEPLVAAVNEARSELAAATFADVRDEAAIRASVDRLRAAEVALATARAEAFARLQGGPNRLTPDQVSALVNAGGNLPGGRGRGGFGGGRGAGGPAGPQGGRGN